MSSLPVRNGRGWSLQSLDDLLVLRCEALEGIPGIAHAFSTRRHGGADDFDLGAADDRSERTRDRRARFLAAANIDGQPAVLQQVHGDRVLDDDLPLDDPPAADGAVWIPGRRVPGIRSADCVPLLIADREGRAAVAVHAGWRGTAAGIAAASVSSLVARGIPASSLLAALGPAIGPCCYEVGGDVLVALGEQAQPTDRGFVDLKKINRMQLLRAGLADDAVQVAPWCTRCRDDLFFSFRREGTAAGRMMAAVGARRSP